MPYRKRVKPGDVIAIPLGQWAVVAGLVLHKSHQISGTIIVGYYDTLFSTVDEIDITKLRSVFIELPNYTFTRPIWNDIWKIIGNSPELLAVSQVPVLRRVYDLYDGDQIIGRIPPEDIRKHPEAGFAYQGYVEIKLRKHFAVQDESDE